MKQYNLSQIMSNAHRKYKSSKGAKSFSVCLKESWALAKHQVEMEKFMSGSNDRFKAKMLECKSNRDAHSINYDPFKGMDTEEVRAALYNSNSKGRYGAHYVGD